MLRKLKSTIGLTSNQNRLAVVYTMGKVASTAYSSAIRAAGLPCVDIHTLARSALLARTQTALDENRFPEPHICQSMAHYGTIRNSAMCAYITGVRDPVERNLSAYFQNLCQNVPEPGDFGGIDPNDLFKRFLKDYNHKIPLVWFDNEMKAQLGIDIYDLKFDPAKRAIFFEEPRLSIIRIDAEIGVKEAMISKVAGKRVRIAPANVGAEKASGVLYHATVSTAAFTSEFLDDIYGSRFCEHFWTEEERKALKAKWLR